MQISLCTKNVQAIALKLLPISREGNMINRNVNWFMVCVC